MNKIFISTTSFGEFNKEPINKLINKGFDVCLNKKGKKLTEEQIIKELSNCIGVIAGTENYSISVLQELKKLKVISRLGVGIDNIDLDYAKKNKIKIFRTKTHPKTAVAELILGLMIDLSRKISDQNQLLKSNIWNKKMGNLVSGKTLGIIGFGNIGKELVKITKGLSFNYLVNDIFIDKEDQLKKNIKICDFDYLIKNSDFISINTDLNDKTFEMFDDEVFSKMKKNAIIINTSRGEIIKESSLISALEKNQISGAGIDVFNQEPYNGPLVKFNNIITTPHIGSYAKEVRISMEQESVDNILSYLNDKI